jgi:PAS domain S-box-containing protein
MSRPLRVLLVEDVEDDALLVTRALRSGGFAPEVHRVERPEAMEEALLEHSWDIVISDYSMPHFSGPGALEVLRKREKDLPFIVVSGTIGEDIAVSMMKNGAQDYLMKGQLARLAPAVERELKEAQVRREKRQSEKELRESEQLFRSAFDSSAVGIILLCTEGCYLQANEKYSSIVGYREEELIQRHFTATTHPSDQAQAQAMYAAALQAGSGTFHLKKRCIHQSGRTVWVSLDAAVVKGEDGRPLYVVGQVQDITERNEAELKIREQAALLDQAPDAILVRNVESEVIYWNKGAERLYGWTAEEALGTKMDEIFHESDLARHREGHQFVLRHGKWTGELRQITRSGEEIAVESRRTLLRDEQGQPKSVLIINTDITARKEAARALADSEERFRQLAEQSSDAFWFYMVSPLQVTYVSPAAERIWGVPVARFYDTPDVWVNSVHPDDRAHVCETFQQLIEGESPRYEAEYRVMRPDGSLCWVYDSGVSIRDESGKIVRLGGMARNITDRKQAETHLLRTQRLESIGTLAGGIAHDLNNALAPILMCTELMRDRYPDSTAMIETVESSAQRGADMVRQLLTFAKGIDGKRLPVQTLALLEDMGKFIASTFPKKIVLRTSFAGNLPTVLGDSTQLHQVLLNLCVNARDAMPDGGTLTLRAETATVDAFYVQAVPDATIGHYVVWRVEDTGTGIPPEVLERIFEPFFSTKDPDKGTGLGLSTTIGIVRSHGGFVRVYSIPGKGTTFAIYLPVDSNNAAPAADLTQKNLPGLDGNNQTILIVDDDVAVLECLRAVLTSLRFKVVTASDGTSAMLLIASRWTELCGVITDLHMPNMDGLAFVRLLREKLPYADVLVTSGRLDDATVAEFKGLGVKALLDKPFTYSKLVEQLRVVLR